MVECYLLIHRNKLQEVVPINQRGFIRTHDFMPFSENNTGIKYTHIFDATTYTTMHVVLSRHSKIEEMYERRFYPYNIHGIDDDRN